MKRVVFVFNAMFFSLLISCGGDGSTESNNNGEISYHENENNEVIIENDYDKNQFIEYYENIKKEFKEVSYAIPLDTTAYFIVSDKELVSVYAELFNTKKTKLGLVDYKGREIIEKNYIKIGNPGIYSDHIIEIQSKNNQYGLFNLHNKKELPTEYDLIFPINLKEEESISIAFAKKGNKYYSINELFEESKIDYEIFQNELNKVRKKFDAFQHVDYFYIAKHYLDYDGFSLEHNSDEMSEIYGTYFTPNYLLNFYTKIDVFEDMAYGGSDWGKVELRGEIDKIEKGNSFTSFILSFFEQGTDARGYRSVEKAIVTIDKNEKIIDRKTLFFTGDYQGGVCDNNASYQYINKNLIEVRTSDHNEEFGKYNYSPKYIYLELDKKGKLNNITPVGAFPFTSMVKINDSYFKGCMEYYIDGDQIPEGMNEETNNVSFKHYSIDDLDKMRAEILARYGFIFSEEPYLSEYFSKKKWYKAQKEDVTGLLTDIERYNLNFILEQISKLQGNEEKYTKPEYSTYYAAG